MLLLSLCGGLRVLQEGEIDARQVEQAQRDAGSDDSCSKPFAGFCCSFAMEIARGVVSIGFH